MKLTHSETASFCRQLALLVHGGIGVADAVFLLAEENTEQLQGLLKEIGTQIDGGSDLAEAMEKADAFPGCVVGMVRIGEKTGCLEEVLREMARFYEQRSRSIRQIKNALTYPAMILVLMLVVIGVLLIKVLPVFEDVYNSLGSGLTGVAAGLLHLGQWIRMAMPVLFVLLGVCLLAVLLYGSSEKVRNRVNGYCAARFSDRGVLRAYNNANFAQALALGLASALPLEEAAEQAGKLLEDVPAAVQRCERCAKALRDGMPLQKAMEESGFLMPAESRMLAVGLRQGSGDQVMAEIAERLMERADELLEKKIAKIEPTMVLVASLLVGMILLSVMLPLMNIMSAIG